MSENPIVKRAPRIPIDVEVNCDGNRFVYSKNISESGIALISEKEFSPGQFIQLKFILPGHDKAINAHGKVVRTAAVSDNFFEVGVSFWDVEDEDKAILEAFFKDQK